MPAHLRSEHAQVSGVKGRWQERRESAQAVGRAWRGGAGRAQGLTFVRLRPKNDLLRPSLFRPRDRTFMLFDDLVQGAMQKGSSPGRLTKPPEGVQSATVAEVAELTGVLVS